ncbi:hypothetical protein ACO2Q3_12445 [Caulobacter sp. KR2-114]|uniref:hypothetical protein n=1 Tax=Caulobacter sp. KR2-114 TaxID=3400912 RepID=UPI003BFC5366
MRRSGLAAIAWAMASTSVSAAALPPPIAPAAEGRLQCYAPNRAARSCQSLASYAPAPGGGIDNPSTVLISPSPVVTMRTTTPVTVKAGQVCGFIRPEDIQSATFEIAGAPATPAQATMLRQKMTAAQQGVFGHEICTAYVPDGDAMIAKASIDGVAQPAMDQTVIWVSPADGFKVAP